MDMTVPQSAKRSATAVNVGPTERVISVLSGVALLAYGATRLSKARRSKAGLVVTLGGGYLVYRGVTGHCVSYSLLGIDRAKQDGQDTGLKVNRSVTIARPREEVYQFWRNLENLPRFMQHVESVHFTADRRSHWIAEGPLGTRVSWDAETTEDQPNERIAWASIPGSDVKNSGWVRFSDAPGGRGTEVYVSLTYSPPAGSAGAAVAKLLGRDASSEVQEDLRRFKQIMETGEAPTNGGQSSGRATDRDYRGNGNHTLDVVAIASEESFPASDAPGWITGI